MVDDEHLTVIVGMAERVDQLCKLFSWAKFVSSPYINHFVQPDTIIPDLSNPQSLNRYSYVLGNPIRFTDPTGHRCNPEDECSGPHYTLSAQIFNAKWRIKDKFGITMSDEGGKSWELKNLRLMESSLKNIDSTLNGNLKALVGGATFWLQKQNAADGQYHGVTHLNGSGIDFFTLNDEALRLMNIYHEVGHLLDNVPLLKDVFTNAVDTDSSWVSGGYVSTNALVAGRVADAYYGTTDATQAYNPGASEEWADAFANFVAGNIDLSKPTGPGRDMYNFVTKVLTPYISDPTRYETR